MNQVKSLLTVNLTEKEYVIVRGSFSSFGTIIGGDEGSLDLESDRSPTFTPI